MKHTPHSNFQLTADEDGNIGIGSVTTRDGHTPTKEKEQCGCRRCKDEQYKLLDDTFEKLFFYDRLILCPVCGNKRCPKATDHRLECTNSNDTGQKGSYYE